MQRRRYEVRLLGLVDDDGVETLRDLDVDVVRRGGLTVVRGELDQAGLHGLLQRARALHLALDDVSRVRVLPVQPTGTPQDGPA